MEVLLLHDQLTLGQRVRLLRIARRWRQVDLAFHAGVEQVEISRLECDHRSRPAAVRAILKALEVEGAADG